jgi:hypothetical protein
MKKVIGIVISAVFAFAVFTAPAQAGGFATQQYRVGAFNTVKMFATYALCYAKDAVLHSYRSIASIAEVIGRGWDRTASLFGKTSVISAQFQQPEYFALLPIYHSFQFRFPREKTYYAKCYTNITAMILVVLSLNITLKSPNLNNLLQLCYLSISFSKIFLRRQV